MMNCINIVKDLILPLLIGSVYDSPEDLRRWLMHHTPEGIGYQMKKVFDDSDEAGYTSRPTLEFILSKTGYTPEQNQIYITIECVATPHGEMEIVGHGFSTKFPIDAQTGE